LPNAPPIRSLIQGFLNLVRAEIAKSRASEKETAEKRRKVRISMGARERERGGRARKKGTGSAREWKMKAMGEEKERKEEKLSADRIDWK
jgi:hypothetical protein